MTEGWIERKRRKRRSASRLHSDEDDHQGRTIGIERDLEEYLLYFTART